MKSSFIVIFSLFLTLTTFASEPQKLENLEPVEGIPNILRIGELEEYLENGLIYFEYDFFASLFNGFYAYTRQRGMTRAEEIKAMKANANALCEILGKKYFNSVELHAFSAEPTLYLPTLKKGEFRLSKIRTPMIGENGRPRSRFEVPHFFTNLFCIDKDYDMAKLKIFTDLQVLKVITDHNGQSLAPSAKIRFRQTQEGKIIIQKSTAPTETQCPSK